MSADEPYPYATTIVRIFPDYAGSVVWFSDPVPYEESALSSELVERLTAWEASYYAALDDDLRWRPTASLHEFSATGLELARAVSAEIGPEFEVQYASFEQRSASAELRSEHPATNPAARDAFAARAARARADWAKTRARLAATPADSRGGWYAIGPGGAILRPSPEGSDGSGTGERSSSGSMDD